MLDQTKGLNRLKGQPRASGEVRNLVAAATERWKTGNLHPPTLKPSGAESYLSFWEILWPLV
jgi:hypothetical protein